MWNIWICGKKVWSICMNISSKSRTIIIVLKNKIIIPITISEFGFQRGKKKATLWTIILIIIICVCSNVIEITMLVSQVATLGTNDDTSGVFLGTKEALCIIVG